MRTVLVVFVLIVINLMVLPATAQETTLFNADEITEAALIEALAPVRTRSFRVQAAPSASMLVTFHTNSAELTVEAKHILNVVGRAFNMDKLADFKFIIEGHTDPRGGFELNQRLSQARADAVRNYLVLNYQINVNRLTPIGKGYQDLLNIEHPNAVENRRVTIVRQE